MLESAGDTVIGWKWGRRGRKGMFRRNVGIQHYDVRNEDARVRSEGGTDGLENLDAVVFWPIVPVCEYKCGILKLMRKATCMM